MGSPSIPGKAVFNPLLPEFQKDPHPLLHRLRAEDPIHFSPVIGVWALTRYDDVVEALCDKRFSASSRGWAHYRRFFFRDGVGENSAIEQVVTRWMLQVDPPDHTRLRGLLNRAFTPRVVAEMRPAIQRIVDDLLDRALADAARRGDDTFDLMSGLAAPLPILVICRLLGAPDSDVDRITRWSDSLMRAMSPSLAAKTVSTMHQDTEAFREYFRGLVAERRRQPGSDMLTALIAARENDDKLDEPELLATLMLLAVAGHATTVQLIGNMFETLLRNPDQLDRLRREPALIGSAVEESLRRESPLQVLFRTTKEPVEMRGRQIPANQMVFLSLAAANRDPEQFPEPDRFDIARTPNRHVAFGYGIHYCPGAPLGRLEAEIAVSTLLRRFTEIRIVEEGVRREPSLLMRGLQSLPLRCDKPAPA